MRSVFLNAASQRIASLQQQVSAKQNVAVADDAVALAQIFARVFYLLFLHCAFAKRHNSDVRMHEQYL